jgi:hypothetical protein
LLGLLTAPGLATTQQDESMAGHHHMMMGAARPTDAPIAITINPEARLSVALGGALPAPVSCGEPAELTVAITNQGFVTSQLEAAFVGDAPAGATLDFHPVPLTGAPNELRALRITLTHPGATDLTIAFHARHEAPDLGERDRVHFLLRCL